jgi:hypothetical protein
LAIPGSRVVGFAAILPPLVEVGYWPAAIGARASTAIESLLNKQIILNGGPD